MIQNFANRVEELYSIALNSTGEERERRIYDLTLYLYENWQKPSWDHLLNFSCRTVRHLRGSEALNFHFQRVLDLIEVAQLTSPFALVAREAISKKNFEPFYQWINAHQKNYEIGSGSSVEDVLSAVDVVRSKLIGENHFSWSLEGNISNIINARYKILGRDLQIRYKLHGKDLNAIVKELTGNREHQLRLIAHACNEEPFIDYFSSLSGEEVKKVALHFYTVPMFSGTISEVWFKDFLRLCENARIVDICHPIKSLSSEDLPPHAEHLILSKCECKTVSLSLPKLIRFQGPSNGSLRSLALQAPLLTHLSFRFGQNLETLSLDTPHLESLNLEQTGLSNLTLDTPFLNYLWIKNDTNLRAITLLHSHRLRSVSFEGCTSLNSILEPGRGLPNCRYLNLHNCPAAIPQVPITTEVYTGPVFDRRDVISFRVNPKTLEENPLKMLLDLGKLFKSGAHFPNIVWINPLTGTVVPGMDCGGLRRHFVASLTEKLPLILEDKLALETFGRLIGFAAESSLLLGSNLPTQFFYELLSEAGSSEIAKGVKAVLGPKWDNWKRSPKETDAAFTCRVRIFADQVQGKPVTMENLFPLLEFEGVDVEKTKEYFRQFFNEFPLLVDERVFQLKHFHQMVQGSLSLEGRPITIHVMEPGMTVLPSIHACSAEMVIPTYSDYQTFKNKLTWAFRAHDTFETI